MINLEHFSSMECVSGQPVLHLWKKNLGNKGTKVIMQSLNEIPYVTVDLSFNGIESEGAKYISDALILNTSVEALILDSNYIQDEGLKHLCQALEVHMQLRDLRISRNYIGPGGCAVLGRLLLRPQEENPIQLCYLDLQWNNIGNKGAVTMANVLRSNHSLTHLNLSRNGITDEGFGALGAALSCNATLVDLILDFNDHSNVGSVAIASGLRVKANLQDVGSDIRLCTHATELFKLGVEYSAADNKTILHALTHRRQFFALRYEFIVLRELSFSERLTFKSCHDGQSVSPLQCALSGNNDINSKKILRHFVQWFLDSTELIFYLILSFLSC